MDTHLQSVCIAQYKYLYKSCDVILHILFLPVSLLFLHVHLHC